MDYDVSKGIDKEVTLFSDQVSLPVGDIGPMTLGSLMEGDFGEAVALVAKEDEEGYLVVESEQTFYSNMVLFLGYMLPDPSVPSALPVSDFSGDPGYGAAALEAFGFQSNPQTLSLRASNPLSEEFEVSGKVTLIGVDVEGNPTQTILTQEFSNSKVPAGADDAEFYRVDLKGEKAVYSCKLENLFLHLPASVLEKDPEGGMGIILMSYFYKAYMSLANDFPDDLPIDLKDLDIPLSQFAVKEARIRADVSSEIPITLKIGGVQALVSQPDGEGGTKLVPATNLDITSDITIASGTYHSPVVTPLELSIKATDGVIPDIAGLKLTLKVLAPTGDGDKRMNMNEEISFNNVRASVFGGITIQGK